MIAFGPETVVRIGCKPCKTVEFVNLGDIPHTPCGLFIIVGGVQCAKCLGLASCEVRDEDQKGGD